MNTSIIPLKRCNCCKQYKPLSEFHKSTRDKDGYKPDCKQCRRKASEVYRRGLGERPKDRVYGDLKQCTKCGAFKLPTVEYFVSDIRNARGIGGECRECKRARSSLYNQTDERRAYARAYYHQNRKYSPHDIEYRRIYRESTKPQQRLTLKRHRTTEKFKAKQRTRIHQRRARKNALPATFTHKHWRLSVDYFHGCCAVCGKQLRDLWGTSRAELDHWIPLSDPHCPGTIPTNILPLCGGIDGCNPTKREHLPDVWLATRFGRSEAARILQRVNVYFDWIVKQPIT